MINLGDFEHAPDCALHTLALRQKMERPGQRMHKIVCITCGAESDVFSEGYLPSRWLSGAGTEIHQPIVTR